MFFTNRILGTLQQLEKKIYLLFCVRASRLSSVLQSPGVNCNLRQKRRDLNSQWLGDYYLKKKREFHFISRKAVNLNCTCPEISLSSNMQVIYITIHTWTHISFSQISIFIAALEICKLGLTFLESEALNIAYTHVLAHR